MAADTPSAVLTGDLIGSTRAERAQVEHTMELLSGGLPAGIRWGWSAAHDLRFTRFRGDGWQMLVPAPNALRWAIVLLASLRADAKALGSRVAIGIGSVTSVGSSDLSDGSGPAFEASGRGLDAMHRDERLFLMGGETGPTREGQTASGILASEKAATILINERMSRWTPEQAEATAHFLHPDKPLATGIAARLHISPQAISYRLKGAGAKAIREALEAMEADWMDRWKQE